MLHRERVQPPEYVYPADEWRIVETEYFPEFQENMETIFSLANGYMGIRGAFEEGRPASENATLINGFHETWPIVYGETAYGFATTGQTIVNVPDMKVVRLYVDDEPLYLPTADLLSFERVLDMRGGFLSRSLVWRTPGGKQVRVDSKRIVSFRDRHLAALVYKVEVENADAPVVVSSHMTMRRDAAVDEGDPRTTRSMGSALVLRDRFEENLRTIRGFRTEKSGMTLSCGMDHAVFTDCKWQTRTIFPDDEHDGGAKTVFTVDAKAGTPFTLVKYFTFHTSRSAPSKELRARAARALDRASSRGVEDMFQAQQTYMDEFWSVSDIQFKAAEGHTTKMSVTELAQAVRFNLFHILQASGRAEGAGIPAKGLTGQAYEGHYFWDTEIYVLPFLVYTAPNIARNLLKFRYSMLGMARQRAREVNQKGALFPWRTINGREASAYYAAGTAQYHINADIMYALRKYVNATGDIEFLHKFGAEMLAETARFWVDLGFFSAGDGLFRIHGVTGPDEYTTVVDNNCFTNLMARENLRYAAETFSELETHHPETYRVVAGKTGLRPEEIEEWRRAVEKMYIPYDEKLGIHPQDDHFLNLQEWDFANTPEDKYPLLLHHHPLVIYRHKVIKQADTVLALFLLNGEFSAEEKKRNFEYYDPLTTGDSSLSVGIQSIIAAETGHEDLALQYARFAMLMDLADVAGNVHHGCHIAAMGAAWMIAVYGVGGFRDCGGQFSFTPHLPDQMGAVRFSLTLKGNILDIELRHDGAVFSLREPGESAELALKYMDREVVLTSDAPTAKLEA